MTIASFDEIVSAVTRMDASRRIDTEHHPAHPQPELDWLPDLVDFRKAASVRETPIDYVIEDLLIAGRAASLTGLGGSSKTTLLFTLALEVALGVDLLGWRVPRPGHAVLVLAEETEEDIQRMFCSFSETLKLNDQQQELLYSRLHIHAAAGYSCRLIDKSRPDDSEKRLECFIRHCEAMGDVRFIGLDPAIALSGGRELDEIDQRDLALAVDRMAIRTGAAVVLVSHAAKGLQYQADVGSHNSRGSGALTDALRLEMLMRVMTGKEAKKLRIADSDRHRFVRFQVTKANRLPPQAMTPKWFERKDAGILTLASIPVGSEDGQSEYFNQREILQSFLDPLAETGELKPTVHRFSVIKTRLTGKGLVSSATLSGQDMAARRLLQRLQKEGLTEQAGQGCWKLSQKGEDLALQAMKPDLDDEEAEANEEEGQ